MAAVMQVSVVSPEARVWTGEATFLATKTVEGEIGIMPGHEPFLGALTETTVRIDPVGGPRVEIEIDGGFLSVSREGVSVLAETAVVR